MVSCTLVLLSAALAGNYNNSRLASVSSTTLTPGLVLQCCGDTERCGECHQVSPLCRHTCAETEQPRTRDNGSLACLSSGLTLPLFRQ